MDFYQEHYRYPSHEELHEITGIELSLIQHLARNTLSIDKPMGDGGYTLDQALEDPPEPSAHTRPEQSDLRAALEKVLGSLTYREREIVKMRYGLGDDREAHTLEAVGRVFKVTRERIRQIEARAMKKLQIPSRVESLGKFNRAQSDDEDDL